jgi:hypothetical protein
VGNRRRLREIVATILLVIGGIGLVVASTGWWFERNLLHTSKFTSTANRILDQDEVQAELTNVLVRQLSRQAGTDLQVAEPFLASIVGQVVNSDAFRSVFDTALSNAHRVLVDRNTGTIILDLTAAYDQVKGALEQVAPKLADQLPSRKQLELVLLHRSQLTTIWDAIDQVKRIVGFLTIGAGLLLVAGVALAVERWRAVARGAWIVAGSAALLALALFVARPVLRSRFSDSVLADAVVASFRVLTTPLLVQTLVVVAVATLVALAARFTARVGLPAWRPVARDAWARVGAALPTSDEYESTRTRRAWLLGSGAESRTTRILRTLVFAALGLFAVFEPSTVASVVVVLVGIGLLVLAVFEGVAAWHAREPVPSGEPSVTKN